MEQRPRALSRREFLVGVVAVSGFVVADPTLAASAQEAELQLTPPQTMGPFYPVTRPVDRDADLTLIQGKPGSAEGKIIHLMGRVLTSAGEPVRGAKIELWQADTHGRYAHPRDLNPAPLDPNFQGYGVQVTDAEGQYRFKTIKPGAYPINPINPDAIRPPHIHFDVVGRYDRLVTQMYFPGEPLNESDSIFSQLRGKARGAAIARVLPPTAEVESDSLIVRWDVVLSRG